MADTHSPTTPVGPPPGARSPGPTTGRRLAWLLVCVGAGALVGMVGSHLSGDTMWWTAVPAAMAVGWLFVANPTECEQPGRQGSRHVPH